MRAIEWRGCYSGNYDLWVEEAYSHPAKQAPGLCFRILDYLEEIGLLTKDSVILDPMAGIGTTGLAAACKGYPSIMVELESKFIDLMQSYWCMGIPKVTVTEVTLPADPGGWRTVSDGALDDNFEPIERTYYAKPVPERKRWKVHSQCRCGKHDWHGTHWFVGNKEYLEKKLRHPIDMTIIQGDSRKLSGLLEERGLVAVMSPPYAHESYTGASEKYRQIRLETGRHPDTNPGDQAMLSNGYGQTPGQIGRLRDRR